MCWLEKLALNPLKMIKEKVEQFTAPLIDCLEEMIGGIDIGELFEDAMDGARDFFDSAKEAFSSKQGCEADVDDKKYNAILFKVGAEIDITLSTKMFGNSKTAKYAASSLIPLHWNIEFGFAFDRRKKSVLKECGKPHMGIYFNMVSRFDIVQSLVVNTALKTAIDVAVSFNIGVLTEVNAAISDSKKSSFFSDGFNAQIQPININAGYDFPGGKVDLGLGIDFSLCWPGDRKIKNVFKQAPYVCQMALKWTSERV